MATAGFYFMKDELEVLDTEKPPRELTLSRGQSYKGFPIINNTSQDGRERLVVLGSGWGSVSLLKTLKGDLYDVTVVSPNNYFMFTPLLPSVTVGTIELRSVLEPIRRILKRTHGSYLEASAVNVDFDKKYVLVEKEGEGKAWIPYDRLVVGVGAQSITHGISGLEHCHKLKSITDARSIRQHIMSNFEKAALPTTPLEEKKRLLTFVVCGGGPTGCEFAAELYDFLAEDLAHYFPESIQNLVNVTIIQSRDHILNMMDSAISKFAEDAFSRRHIKVITNSRVAGITANTLKYTSKSADGAIVEHEIPQGFVLWSTGLSLTPFTRLICDKFPEHQSNHHAVTVDDHLRIKGVPDGSAYALGDCATVELPHLLTHISELFDAAKPAESKEITRDEFSKFVRAAAGKYPMAASHLNSLDQNFDHFDTDGNGTICLSEFQHMLEYVDSKLTALPALAQVASQEGKYLGSSLNKLAKKYAQIDAPLAATADMAAQRFHFETDAVDPFNYHHRGTLAYLGRAAAADFGDGQTYKGSNLAAKYLWRSAYWSQQVSFRTRLLLMMDWSKELLFGRDISKF
ncbi:hypothetical protein GGI12_004245 [Dipsacomyces acuminosporus]|nr:hypothetical protein GGI12_004245 [Dipsacomyces acuminosporus]